ncbi:MAG: class I SAM-dependent DNA methyltransferase [Candidatus Thorarchaeota archaeon]
MSEELIQKGLQRAGIKIANYEYYNLGATTLKQLKQYKIIPQQNYKEYSKRKPDGLLVNRQSKSTPKVIATIEYKKPSEFRNNAQQKEAIQQCNDLCQELKSKMGIITDGQIFFWINPWQNVKENKYIDKTTRKKRSYAFIRNEDKKDLSEPFIIQKRSEVDREKLNDETKNTLYYINRILSCINENNSILIPTEEVDPLGLARSVWQDIYINTGKDPSKCLYNVVELFIFKFLSDLNILNSPYDFESLLKMYDNGNDEKDVLEYYARNSRNKIRELFPAGKDKTTIINGTIFVDSNGNPVLSQAYLFKKSLEKYKAFGSLKYVRKEFKTKLFETFLKQSDSKSRLGQFLTPRKVVSAIVDMSDVENLPNGSRFCDPFCGVGGFICEPLHKSKRKNDFVPKNGKIKPSIVYHGFDKGSDDEEERTIILAKANMLIYLSEIIEKYPNLTSEFATAFNNIYQLLTDSNLGTLKKVIDKEDDKYDLILTNPPYITSGVTSIKDEIKSEGLEEYYTTGAKGVEGLALEWIARSLRKDGKAFIIIPDSILNVGQNKALRKYLLQEFFINCIISLPIKTFFNTPKKTYILGITKKDQKSQQQDFPIFTYLVNNIGETLDINRFEIEGKSDLEKAKELFNTYKGAPKTFPVAEIGDPRCKLQPIKKFETSDFWTIDKWWSEKEKIKLGIEEEKKLVSVEEFKNKLDEFVAKIDDYKKMLDQI